MNTVSPNRTRLVLIVLFLGTFILGTAELIVPGMLNLMAADLDVSIPAAGMLVTANALGLALGGPVLTALTIRLPKRTILSGALSLFLVANLVLVLTDDYSLFLVARVLAGAAQGLAIAAALEVGTSIVPPERMGRAIAVVISGFSVSAALGVPLGTLAGQSLGWRGTFIAIVVLAALTLAAVIAVVPPVPASGGGIGSQARYAFAPRVLAVLGFCFLMCAAEFAALTYIVPFLEQVTGVSGTLISVFLLAYGVATAFGSFGGGRFADSDAPRALIIGSCGLAISLLVLYLAGAIAAVVVLALLAMGVFSMGMVSVMQYRVVSLAGPGAQLAQSLPASFANLGVALGSTAGGIAIGGFSTAAAVLTGFGFACATVVVAWATSFLKPPTVSGRPLPEKAPAAVQTQ
ncbi:Predicted arabinose efflux permease, MFS family [Amycolatopsis arida]|uniref:Predicted arabinose efflux permease, MFS family n=1 Tax=Amycolatopsis arida TaxID=587909 RepID=A0A1I6AMU9_9PSEU|nr:MFS transporter [Amycolatopsis arida]TDX87417.1 putative MFS family arabinose efflux permease [Amycolatopsis arida]SFQ70013.1 Predicted arabinose efflux permease, MFS family [Amycolatopsis arida]